MGHLRATSERSERHKYAQVAPSVGDESRVTLARVALLDLLATRAPAALVDSPVELLDRRITEGDAARVLDGFDHGLISWGEATHFDTLDRPRPPRGRWWLTERDGDRHRPCWEFIPQLAAYVELIDDLGYHPSRVLFDTPQSAGQLDLAVLANDGSIAVCGEAKKESRDLKKLLAGVTKYAGAEPDFNRGDEPRQLAWRLWRSRAPYLWLVGPSDRRAFFCSYEPLALVPLDSLPSAAMLGLDTALPEGIQLPVLSP